MKAEFEMTLFDDAETHRNLPMLNRLEALFDHSQNELPEEYYWFSDNLPVGSRVKITFEVMQIVLKSNK